MKKRSVFNRLLIAALLAAMLFAGFVPAQTASAAGTVYSGASTVALVYDQSDCYSMQGFNIYGNYLYAVKANTDSNANACIARINKDTGDTVYMTDSSGNKYFTYLGHANDMDIVNVNGVGNMFITTGKPGSGSLVRFSMSGTKLTKAGSYNVTYNGTQVSYGGVSVMHADSQYVTFMFKTGSNFFTGKLDVSKTSGTIELTKLFNINKTAIDFGGTVRDLSAWIDQGFEYYDNKIFVPLTGNHQTSTIATSAIAVYNVEGASGVIYNDPTYSFYINSTVYPGLFEIESLSICPYDGKLYFSTNGRKSSSSTNYDGVHSINSFVYQPDNRTSATNNFRWEVVDDVLTPVTTNSNSYNGLAHLYGSISGGTMTNGMYCVSEPIILNHGTRWIVEWKTSGTGSNHMLLSTESSANNPGHTYLLCSTGNGIIAFGYTDASTGKNHNYGINLKDHGIDGTKEHVYQLYNKQLSSGGNMIYLSVDGVELGAMNNYFIGLTSQKTTSDWLSGKDLKFSYFGTHEYRINKSNLEYIQVWGKSLQHSVDEPDSYRWEKASDGFNPVAATGLTVNTPKVMLGGVTGGKFSGAQYQLSRDVVLRHDRPWVMEWQSEGQFTGGAMLLAAHERNNAYNAPYLFRYSGSSLLAFGCYTGSEHSNYGINLADAGIDATASHVYQLTNRINADGSNMIYLSVDGKEIGPMNNYFSGINNKNSKVNWVSGKDFTFSYMGTLQSKLNDGILNYFQIWENGIPADHQTSRYRWEIGNSAMTSVTTNGFVKNDVTYVFAKVDGNTIINSNFRMDKSVVLRHDMPWSISWDSQGFSGSATAADMILASSNYHNQKYYTYILRTRDGNLITIGEFSDTHHNYGIKLSDHNIDSKVAHTYSLRNVVNGDGSNMIYLYVDGKEVGPMNGHYIGVNYQNETSNYLSGMDLTFTFMGTYNYLIQKDTLTYIEINEGCSHSFGAWTENAATCTEDGSRTRSCTYCGYTESEVIAAKGHSYKSVVTAPTCTEEGYTTHTCSSCGHSYKDSETTPKGHSYKTVTVDATCTADGKITKTCSTCGHVVTETIPATGHSYKSVVTAPTCTEGGYTTYTCSTCGYSYKGNETAAKGHSYENGSCLFCGAQEPGNETENDPIPNGTITLKNVSLTLEDEIHYNLYFTYEGTAVEAEDMGLILWDTEPVDASINGGGQNLTGAVYVESSNQYCVSTEGVAAKNMGDTKYMMAYARLSDGNYVYSRVLTYSARTYCMNRVKNSSNENMRALCVAMMNYGAEAQKFFAAHGDYTYTELMNVGFEEYQYLVKPYADNLLNMPTTVDAVKAGSLGTGVNGFTSRSVSMSADGNFQLNYYFTTSAPADKVMFYYWTADRYAVVDTLTLDNASGSVEMEPQEAANTYWASYPGIAAKDMDKTVFACGVYEKDGKLYTTGVISYSLARYCISRVAAGGDFANLAAATAVYGYHAKSYFIG